MTTARPARVPRWVAVALWCLAAAAAPVAAGGILEFAHRRALGGARLYETLGVGVLTGAIVGLLVALRTRRLLSFVLYPPLGLLAGMLDLHAFRWLCHRPGAPIRLALLIPVWGALLGLLAGSTRRRPLPIALVCVLVLVVDFATRWVWLEHGSHAPGNRPLLDAWRWALDPLSYAPPAALAVALVRGPIARGQA